MSTDTGRHRFGVFGIGAWAWGISLVLAPILYVFVISFMTRGPYGGVLPVFTLENYQRLFNSDLSPLIVSALVRSVILATFSTFSCLLVAFPLVLFLVFRAGRWKGALFLLLIIPFWTNFLIRTYAWFVLLSDQGWINAFLERLGFGPQALHLLFTPEAMWLGMFYNYLPYMAISLYVSVERLDRSLLDAAADLGAGPLKRFVHVIIPSCLPGLVAGSIMVFIPSLGEFVIPDVLGGGTKMFIGSLLAQQFLSVRHWPFGSAITVMLMVLFAGGLFVVKRLQKESADAETFA